MLSYANVCIFLISVPGDGQLLSKIKWILLHKNVILQCATKLPMNPKSPKSEPKTVWENVNGYIFQTTMMINVCEALIRNTTHLGVLHSIHWLFNFHWLFNDSFPQLSQRRTCFDSSCAMSPRARKRSNSNTGSFNEEDKSYYKKLTKQFKDFRNKFEL